MWTEGLIRAQNDELLTEREAYTCENYRLSESHDDILVWDVTQSPRNNWTAAVADDKNREKKEISHGRWS